MSVASKGLARLYASPGLTPEQVSAVRHLFEQRRKELLDIDDMPNWAEAELPDLTQLRLGAKVGPFLLDHDASQYGGDQSAALYGAANVLASNDLDDATVLAVIMDRCGYVAAQHTGSDDGNAQAQWLWKYTVGQQCKAVRLRRDPSNIFGIIERGEGEGDEAAPGELREGEALPAPAEPRSALQALLGAAEELLHAPTEDRRREMIDQLLDAALREALDPVSRDVLLHRIKEHTGYGIATLKAQERAIRDRVKQQIRQERLNGHDVLRAEQRYVLVDTMGSMLWDRTQHSLVPKASFRDAYDADTVAGAFSGGELPGTLQRVATLTYVPGAPELIEWKGVTRLNTYRPGTAEMDLGDVSPWLDQFTMMGMPQAEQAHLLDWMAWIVQRPARKIRHAVVIGGPQGIGKDTVLTRVMQHCLGRHNVSTPEGSQIVEQYNAGWTESKQLAVVQEAEFGSRKDARQIANALKPIITEPMISVRRMYEDLYETPNMLHIAIQTNSRQALMLDPGDRRYFLTWCAPPDTESARASAAALYRWYESGGLDLVYGFLLCRSLNGFDANRAPPDTIWKQRTVTQSMGEVAQVLQEMAETRQGLFRRDVIEWSALLTALKTPFLAGGREVALPERVNRMTLNKALDELGWAHRKCQWRHEGTRQYATLVTVRNQEHWGAAEKTDRDCAVEAGLE